MEDLLSRISGGRMQSSSSFGQTLQPAPARNQAQLSRSLQHSGNGALPRDKHVQQTVAHLADDRPCMLLHGPHAMSPVSYDKFQCGQGTLGQSLEGLLFRRAAISNCDANNVLSGGKTSKKGSDVWQIPPSSSGEVLRPKHHSDRTFRFRPSVQGAGCRSFWQSP